MTTHERNIDEQARRALQELLAGREPKAEDTAALTRDVGACISALVEALHADGVQAVRKAFTALVKDNRPWLGKLASQGEGGSEQEQRPARRIRFRPTSEFLNRPPQQWLIPGILPKDGIAMVYGLSGAY